MAAVPATPVPAPVPAPVAAPAPVPAPAPAAVAVSAAAAVAAPSGPVKRNEFNRRWLTAADKNRQPFADELFNTVFSQETIEKQITDLKALTDKKVSESLRLVDDDHTFSIQLTSFGWLKVPMHLTRIELPYTVLAEDSPVCIFVKDIKRPVTTPARNAKPANIVDLTIKHYEQLFNSKRVDISNITFIPLSQLINDFTSYDQRRKLTFLYDKFMVEASIGARVNAFLGTKLLMDGRVAYPIDLGVDDLSTEYDIVLRQVVYQATPTLEYQFNKPLIRVGRYSQTVTQVAENIIDLIGQIGTLHPAGSQNIQSIYLRTNGQSTYVQLYSNPATSAPEIAEPVPEEGAEPVDAETTSLTEPAFNVSQHVICSHHYIMSEEDDYSLEFTERVFFDRNPVKAAPGGGGAANVPAKANAAAGGAKAGPAKAGAPAAGGDLNALVMRSLQKLLASKNIGSLIGGGAGGPRPRVAANGNVVRRTNPNGGTMVRRQGTANNAIQKRRFNQNGNGPANGNVRNNRRF